MIPLPPSLRAHALFLACLVPIHAATFTVSKDGRGAFQTIQAAVDKASANDVVEILDTAVYAEQVTLDATKAGLVLRSSNPRSASKPVIRYQDVTHQHPKNCQESFNPASVDFTRNGAVRVLGTAGATLEGLSIDGGGPAPFAWPYVWGNGADCNGQLYPLFHGNAALAVYRSSRITIRDCHLSNAFFGVFVDDGNLLGAFSPFSFPGGGKLPSGLPGFAGTGGHLFENDQFLMNSFGAGGRSLWGLPSTFRNNRFYRNGHVSQAAARAVKAMPDGGNRPGGAFYLDGDPICPWAIEHNTFSSNALVVCSAFQPNANHLVHANLIGPPMRYGNADSVFGNSFMETLPYLWNGMALNLVAAQSRAPSANTCDIRFKAFDSALGDTAYFDTTIAGCAPLGLLNGLPAPESRTDTVSRPILSGGRSLIGKAAVSRSVSFAPLLDAKSGAEASRSKANLWWEAVFTDPVPGAEVFLEPAWPAGVPAALRPPDVSYGNGRGEASLPGRIPAADQASTAFRIVPVGPAVEVGGELELSFEVMAPGSVSDIGFAGWVPVQIKAVPFSEFGGSAALRENSPFAAAALPAAALQPGFNRIRVPRPWPAGSMGLIQMLARGRAASGGWAYSDWTAIPSGIIRKEIGISFAGLSANGPIEAPADGKLSIALTLPAEVPAGTKVGLIRLSGIPILGAGGNADTLGWLTTPIPMPIQVSLPIAAPGDPIRPRYDAVIAVSAAGGSSTPAYTGMSPLLRYPGATTAAKPANARSHPAAAPALRDALGRRTGSGERPPASGANVRFVIPSGTSR